MNTVSFWRWKTLHKVVIIDDEHFVRKGIIALVDWAKIDYQVVGEADNGEDAIALILKEEPDVVLTDIRMPVYDGLELIKRIKERAKDLPKFIIVSGYDDFKYAQKAVRLGVSDFILKPVNKTELEETLTKLSSQIYEERMEQQTNQAFINHSIFQRIIIERKEPTHKDLSTITKAIEKPNRYLLIDVRGTSTDTVMDEKIQHAVSEFIGDDDLFIHPIDREGYGIVLEQRHLPKNENEISWFFDHFKSMLEQAIDQKIFVFSGVKEEGLSGIITSYETAKKASNYRYLVSDDQPLIFDKHINEKISDTHMFPPTLMQRMIEQVEENNASQIESLIDEWATYIQSQALSIEQVRLFLLQLDKTIEDALRKASDNEAELEKPFGDILMHKMTLNELRSELKEYLVQQADKLSSFNKAKYNGDIYKVKRYIDRHYHENLTLKKMANKFFMNPVYLGQLFKKTYGIYFKDYLLSIRIEKAKEILRQTDLRVYEVAEEVGFGSSDYFVTQFEKIEGYTPSRYRQKLLKNDD